MIISERLGWYFVEALLLAFIFSIQLINSDFFVFSNSNGYDSITNSIHSTTALRSVLSTGVLDTFSEELNIDLSK